jgi:hypothetical protein
LSKNFIENQSLAKVCKKIMWEILGGKGIKEVPLRSLAVKYRRGSCRDGGG